MAWARERVIKLMKPAASTANKTAKNNFMREVLAMTPSPFIKLSVQKDKFVP